MRISDWSSDVCSSDLGFDQASAQRLVAARTQRPFVDVEDLVARAALDKPACEALARGNALRRLAGHRHRAFWAVAGARSEERRVGKECVSTGRSWGSPDHSKKKQTKYTNKTTK